MNMKEINTQYQLDTLLKRVEKPGRYIGGELFSAQKDLRRAARSHFRIFMKSACHIWDCRFCIIS